VLHVTCGDLAAQGFARAGITQDALPWRDVLHEGPVPGEVTDAELRDIRAGFIAGNGWSGHGEVLAFFTRRDALLRDCSSQGVILWFEADLYDQLQLLEVVSKLLTAKAAPESVRVFQGAGFGGYDAATLSSGLRPLDAGAMRRAHEAWLAFRASDPSDLARRAGEDIPGLPFVAGAVRRLLEEYPAEGDGLSRLERTLLQAASAGPVSGHGLFRVASAQEEHRFLGDMQCWLVASRLMGGERPLLSGGEGDFPDRMVRLTAAGARTLAGEMDWMRTGGQGRWIGGVRLGHGPDWRFKRDTATLARVAGPGDRP